jgi:Uma2 family endonuclease
MTTGIADIKHEVKETKRYTLREYLQREERALHKHEYHQGQIKRMAGGKTKHNEIATNITTAIKYTVKSLPKKFRVYNSDQKIYVEALDKALYPDAVVVCEEPQYWENREDLIINPLLIVEVASHSTRTYDRGDKFLHYELLPSFKEYVLVEQNKPHVEAWFREDEITWKKTLKTQIEDSILLRSIGASILLSDIYDNIDFKKKL